MEDLSLHILDVAENSIEAGATLIEIGLIEDHAADTLTLTLKDNGRGMGSDFLQKVRDPFTTTRTTRRVGLGIPLLEQAAVETGGDLSIKSEPGTGTLITAKFILGHIDRKPVGDMGATMVALITGNPKIDFVFKGHINGEDIELDTREIRDALMDTPLSHPDVVQLIRELFKIK